MDASSTALQLWNAVVDNTASTTAAAWPLVENFGGVWVAFFVAAGIVGALLFATRIFK